MKKILLSILLSIPFIVQVQAQTPVFQCGTGFTAFNTTPGTSAGLCNSANAYQLTGYNFGFFGSAAGANISAGAVNLQPAGTNHKPTNFDYVLSPVSTTAFTTHYRFSHNAWNTAFILNNVTHNAGAGPAPGFTLAQGFSGGAGCEEAIYQAFGGAGNFPANNIFALNFDTGNLQINALSPNFYSHVQIYQQLADPCIPSDGTEPWYYRTNKVSTSPVPLASPSTTWQTTTGDTYDAVAIYSGKNLTVNLYDLTAGGTCSPVTSGTCFTYNFPNLSIPSWVNGTTAWTNLGSASNANTPNNLIIPLWTFSTLAAAAIPTFSPASGTYGSTQSVTISDSSSGSTICYNFTGDPMVDGNGSCINSTKYTTAVSVPKGLTIFAVAGQGSSAYGDSTIGTASYKITGFASQPTFNQPGGTWQGNQNVQLVSAAGGTICYNTSGSPATNGSTGCTTGTLYTTPITVSSNETLYAVSGGTGFTDSAISSAAYIISPFAVINSSTGSFPSNSPTFSPVAGNYSGSQSVSLASTTTGSNICYLLSTTLPTLLPTPNNLGGCAVGTPYSGPISVVSSTTIYASAGTTVGPAVAGTGPSSSVSTASYTIGGTPIASSPVFSPSAGTYTSAQNVAITTSAGSVICYSTTGTPATNGTTGCTTGTHYTGPVNVVSSETLYAVAGGTGYVDSAVVNAPYVIQGTAATPVITLSPGTYTMPQTTTITDSTGGSTITYDQVTSGTCTPNTTYTGAVTINAASTTVCAYATASGFNQSATATSAYTQSVTATPAITLAGGTYTFPQTTTITDPTGGATILYCTGTYGGSCIPGTTYTGTITISTTESLCSNATATGYQVSALRCNNYAQSVPSGTTYTVAGNSKLAGNIVLK